MDVSKLKVADLRLLLNNRGLNTEGNKPILVERLKEAVEKEAENEEEDEEESENEAEKPKKGARYSQFDQPEEKKRRKNSPSPSTDDYLFETHCEDPPKILDQNDEDEPSYHRDSVLLSSYDSDLNLVINEENFVRAVPLTEEGFMYMWGGARSTYGFNFGKVYYEVKLEECMGNTHDEFEIHSFRLGWSVAYSSLQLGETPLSYGYDSSGKKCTNDTFEEYGQPFNAEDAIGCLLDFETSEEDVLISFAFNGVKQEVAFEVPKTSLKNKALFPHILSKNISFEVNFGDRIKPWNAVESFREDFEWASKVPLEQRIQGPKNPEKKAECEVILSCGSRWRSKTIWVNNYVKTHSEKMYNVIGIDFALNKMKVLNEPIQNLLNDASDDVFVEKCTRSIDKLINSAPARWRNYIIDQPNISDAVRNGTTLNFNEFKCSTFFIVPKYGERNETNEHFEFLLRNGDLFANTISFYYVDEDIKDLDMKYYDDDQNDSRSDDVGPCC